MKHFAGAAFVASVSACSACGHDARAPIATADAGTDRAVVGASDAAANDASASLAEHRALPSELDVATRAASLAPGLHIDHSETRTSPFRLEISAGDAGASCLRVLVASDSPVDVHLEDAVGPRGSEAHGVDAIVPSDGPLCLAGGASNPARAFLVARGTANVRVAVLVPNK